MHLCLIGLKVLLRLLKWAWHCRQIQFCWQLSRAHHSWEGLLLSSYNHGYHYRQGATGDEFLHKRRESLLHLDNTGNFYVSSCIFTKLIFLICRLFNLHEVHQWAIASHAYNYMAEFFLDLNFLAIVLSLCVVSLFSDSFSQMLKSKLCSG
jgi:hypothetical protein